MHHVFNDLAKHFGDVGTCLTVNISPFPLVSSASLPVADEATLTRISGFTAQECKACF